MFDLADRALVWIPVKWGILKPSDKPDGIAVEHEVSIEIEVEIKDRDELVALTSEMFGNDGLESDNLTVEQIAAKSREKELSQFMSIVQSWRKFKNGGKEVEFSIDNARKLLAVPGFLNGFQQAYFSACAGKIETRKGN